MAGKQARRVEGLTGARFLRSEAEEEWPEVLVTVRAFGGRRGSFGRLGKWPIRSMRGLVVPGVMRWRCGKGRRSYSPKESSRGPPPPLSSIATTSACPPTAPGPAPPTPAEPRHRGCNGSCCALRGLPRHMRSSLCSMRWGGRAVAGWHMPSSLRAAPRT
jgi:hypothetical protein